MAKKPSTDQKTLLLMKDVASQREAISNAVTPSWKTNCSFAYEEGKANIVNLHVKSNIKNLISIAAFLRQKHASYTETVAALDVLDAPAFTWANYKLDDWLSDIKSRTSQLQLAARRKKLQDLENRLNAIISPEMQAEMELERITLELKK